MGKMLVGGIRFAGKENLNAASLSRNPHNPPPDNGIGEGEVQIAMITNVLSASDLEKISNNSEVTITDVLQSQDCVEGILNLIILPKNSGRIKLFWKSYTFKLANYSVTKNE